MTYKCAVASACDGNKNVVVVAKLKHVQNPVVTSAKNEMSKSEQCKILLASRMDPPSISSLQSM